MIIFSGLSLYLTSLIIKGFVITADLKTFILASIFLAIIYYLLTPIIKLILLPLNLLTLGFFSVVVYVILFNYVINKFNFVNIKPWVFPGYKFGDFSLPAIEFNYWLTLVSSSIFYSTVINLLEILL